MATTSVDAPALPIDFVPEENVELLQEQTAGWILANGFMGMTEYAARSLEQLHMGSLVFGGRVAVPDGTTVEAYAVLSVDMWPSFKNDRIEDPEGTRWSRNRPRVQVQVQNTGECSPAVSRRRIAILEAVTELAERLERHLEGVYLWRRGSTRAEREAAAAAQRMTDMKRLVAGAVALECAGMRVGSEKMGVTPPGVDKGTYDVDRADKAYRAYVTNNKRFNFVRIK